jgi:hypothetical protein
MDNHADILTAACQAREHYAEELRIAERDRAVLDARVAMLREFLDALTPRPKRTRQPKQDTPPDAPQGTLEPVEDIAA